MSDDLTQYRSAIFSEGCFAKKQKSENFLAAINGLPGVFMKNNPANGCEGKDETQRRKDAKRSARSAFVPSPAEPLRSLFEPADGIPAQ
jgi:hypothetical protein